MPELRLEPSKIVMEAIGRWVCALENLEDTRRRVNHAQCEKNNAESDMVKFLIPEDAQEGETFNIWYLDGLISVTAHKLKDPEVKWRKKPTPR